MDSKFQVISLLTTCLVITGAEEEDFSNFYDVDNFTDVKKFEELPTPSPQVGPEARNYVAYIPVPINEGEEEDEYYDDDDEYYDDDDYYEDDDEYYYEDEDEPPRKSHRPKRKKSSKRKRPNRRKYGDESSNGDKERVPFLVPLMMVPENQVGLEKEFSFSKNKGGRKQDDDGGIFTSILNLGEKKGPPLRNRIPPSRFQRPRGPPARNVHDVPGPPYRGPHPRNPNLPLDNTVIHPSNLRPRFRRPPRNFRNRNFYPNPTSTTTAPTTTTELTTTTTVETTTKSKPSIIVVQQRPSYNPYQPSAYNPYQPAYQPFYPQQPYPYPPPTPQTTTTTSTTTTTTTTTTTKKPRKKRRKKKPAVKPEKYNSKLSEDQITSLSQPQLTIKNNKVVPIVNPQQQSILTKRFGLPAVQSRRIRPPPYKIRGRRRLPHKMGMSQSYDPKMPYRDLDRRFDMPNIFTQSGYPYDNKYEEVERPIITRPPPEERPIISRPPPRHPGVRVPGVRVPANAGSIEDIIQPKPVSHNRPPNGYKPPQRPLPQRPPPQEYNRPYRPPPSQNQYLEDDKYFNPEDEYGPVIPDYQRPPPEDYYNPPPRPTEAPSYVPPTTTKKYGKPPYRYTPPPYESPKPRPPPPSYENKPYRPPPTDYSQQPSDKYDQPPAPASTYYEKPPPPAYQEPSNSYRPSRPPTTVVPPAYNQDYYLTSDPQNDIYPGPDIYDGGSVHGPSTNDRNPNYQNTNYQSPTLGPPTTRPEYGYDRPKKYDPYERPNKYKPYDKPKKYDKYEEPNEYDSYKPPPKDYSYQYSDQDKIDSPYHPDGPDYSSGTLVHSYKGSTPFKVGVDLYPIEGVSPLGNFGKQDIYSSVIPNGNGKNHDDNKHEILLHLNLFSKKPASYGGRAEDIDIDLPSPFTR